MAAIKGCELSSQTSRVDVSGGRFLFDSENARADLEVHSSTFDLS